MSVTVVMRATHKPTGRAYFWTGPDEDTARKTHIALLVAQKHPNAMLQADYNKSSTAWIYLRIASRWTKEEAETVMQDLITGGAHDRRGYYHSPQEPVISAFDVLTREHEALVEGFDALEAEYQAVVAERDALKAAPTTGVVLPLRQVSDDGETSWASAEQAAAFTGNSLRGIQKAIETGEEKYGFRWVLNG